jgi:hypothetical protein
MQNTVTIQGTLKNIREYTGTRGTLLTGWLNQRDVSRFSNDDADRIVYVAGINIIAKDDNVVKNLRGLDISRQGAEETTLVTLTGRLVTHFDRRQNVAESARRAPQLQLEVYEISVD